MSTDVVGSAYIELRARGSQLGADIRNTVDRAVAGSTTTATTATKGLTSEVKGLVNQFSGLFGSSAVTSTAMQGFAASETAAAAGASSLATPVTAAIAGVVALGAGAQASLHAFSDFGAEVLQFQRITGASAREASSFAAVFDRFGISADTGSRALAFMARNADKNREALQAEGVTLAANANGSIDLSESFKRVAEAVSNTTDKGKQADIIQKSLGRGGLALLPVLAQGRDGFDQLADAARKAGISLDEEGVQRAKELKASMKDLGEVIKGTEIQVGSNLAPAVTKFLTAVTPAIELVGRALAGMLNGVSAGVSIVNALGDAARGDFKGAGAELAGVMNKTGTAIKDASIDLTDLGESSATTEDKLKSFVDTEIAIAHETLDAKDAVLAFQDAQTNAADVTKHYNELLNRSGQIAKDLAAAQRDLKRSTEDIGLKQMDVTIAETRFGTGSRQAIEARLALSDAQQSVADKQDKVNQVLDESGPKGTETAKVAREMAKANDEVAAKALSAADAANKLDEDLKKADETTVDATAHALSYVQALLAIAQTLAPGSPLRTGIEAFAGSISTTFPNTPADQTTADRRAEQRAQQGLSTVSIQNVFHQPVSVQQAADLNGLQGNTVGGGSRRSLL